MILRIEKGLITATLIIFPLFVSAQTTEEKISTEQVIQSDLEHRDIVVPKIDTEDFEVGVFTGILSIEDFGSNSVSGIRLAYHVTEGIFFEGVYGKSTVSDTVYRQILPGGIFEHEHEELVYYNLSLGYNIFPGEMFLTKDFAMTSAVYVIGGLGVTAFANEDRNTFNFGIGFRILPTDWLAIHIDMRDHIFDNDILGESKTTHNFELHGGLTIFF